MEISLTFSGWSLGIIPKTIHGNTKQWNACWNIWQDLLGNPWIIYCKVSLRIFGKKCRKPCRNNYTKIPQRLQMLGEFSELIFERISWKFLEKIFFKLLLEELFEIQLEKFFQTSLTFFFIYQESFTVLVHCGHLWTVLYMTGNMGDIFLTHLEGESHLWRNFCGNPGNSSEWVLEKPPIKIQSNIILEKFLGIIPVEFEEVSLRQTQATKSPNERAFFLA